MKHLYTEEQWTLAILDGKNYVLYDNTKPRKNTKTGVITYKMNYFTHHDLVSWVSALESSRNRLVDAVTVTV